MNDLRFQTTELCEWCGIRPATEHHHCLVNRDKNNRELDNEHNIGHVCRECHSQWIGTGGREVREAWWWIQVTKYGEDEMRAWWDALCLKVKERYDMGIGFDSEPE